jgi:RecA/RadA recombinase
MSLIDKLLKVGSTDNASIISTSTFFNDTGSVDTHLPILNLAFSGEIEGGFSSGLTILAGESKTFKSALCLYCMKAYMDKYKDAVSIFYDSEFGISKEYLKNFGIDMSRIIHIPVEHIEQLKFDMTKKLGEIKKGDRVFMMVDSIGQIASKKEIDDSVDEKSVADMTRAKAIRSLLRMVTVKFKLLDIPCFMVNHVYQSIGMFSSTVIPGGTAVTYSANNLFVITKAQEKASSGELEGWNFTINAFKSRSVKEKSKFPIRVLYDGGIQKYSGMVDLVVEAGLLKASAGWYQIVDLETGEIIPNKMRIKQVMEDEVIGKIIKSKQFSEWVNEKYKLGSNDMSPEVIEELDEDWSPELDNQ